MNEMVVDNCVQSRDDDLEEWGTVFDYRQQVASFDWTVAGAGGTV